MKSPFALVAALIVLGACSAQEDRGGFGEPQPSLPSAGPSPVPLPVVRPVQVVRVAAPGGLLFEPATVEIRAGRLTQFVLSNEDAQEHTFVISELAVVMLAGAGQRVTSTVAVDRGNTGRFAYFCSIGGHRQAGMEGTITVRPK
jgi:plastocyanin